MISLKKTMDKLDEAVSRAEAALESCSRLLTALEHAAATIAGEDSTYFRDQVGKIRSALVAESSPSAIMEAGQSIEKELDAFAKQRAHINEERDREYKRLIYVVTEVATTIVRTGSSQSKDLMQFAAKIDEASRSGTLADVRKQLSKQVSELKNMAKRIGQEAEADARRLESKIQVVEEKLRIAESLAETDVLTGLGNRRMAETAIQSMIAASVPFSLLLFDLNGFKGINDRYGHQQGDQLLKSVARDLTNAVRGSDVVCRWGGDEFLVLLKNSRLAGAEVRAVQIEASAFGEYFIDADQRKVRINISASVGIAEYQDGESAYDFFERADKIMYEKKARRRAHHEKLQHAS